MSKNSKIFILIFVGFISEIRAMGLDLSEVESEDDDNNRAIIVATGLNFENIFGLNLTNLAPLLALGAAALLPLLCLCALGVLLLASLAHKGGYDSGGYSSHSSNSYSEYAARAIGLSEIDWEKLSIVDWISLGEETFRKFDPSNLECHKRVICEVHQNFKEFGTIAARFVDIFGYLKYVQILSLPESIKSLVDEFTDAADRGRSLNKDCGDMYDGCDYSIKSLYDRYSDNSL
ncbi:UNVERIFIED_CONTAM: hypothetical protein RMT77_009679 [Armadillidium vulgare]